MYNWAPRGGAGSYCQVWMSEHSATSSFLCLTVASYCKTFLVPFVFILQNGLYRSVLKSFYFDEAYHDLFVPWLQTPWQLGFSSVQWRFSSFFRRRRNETTNVSQRQALFYSHYNLYIVCVASKPVKQYKTTLTFWRHTPWKFLIYVEHTLSEHKRFKLQEFMYNFYVIFCF